MVSRQHTFRQKNKLVKIKITDSLKITKAEFKKKIIANINIQKGRGKKAAYLGVVSFVLHRGLVTCPDRRVKMAVFLLREKLNDASTIIAKKLHCTWLWGAGATEVAPKMYSVNTFRPYRLFSKKRLR